MPMLIAKEISDRTTYTRHYRKPITELRRQVVYPDRDGKRMADNTEQFNWIVKIKENLEHIFSDNPDVFVAGDLLWYPVKDSPKIRMAPDTMVVFGRPKGYRGSYKMWEEGDIAPQVVFEILSPGNTRKEMEKKFIFYEKYGVSEYYIYDPDRIRLEGWIRRNNILNPIEYIRGWISPLLKICFEPGDDDLQIFSPDGSRFLSRVESERFHRNTELRYQEELLKAENLIASERLRADRMAAKLRELGVEV